MKVIIAGSRDITDLRLLEKIMIDCPFNVSEVVCGGARGVDDLGRKWAGDKIPVRMFPANWDKFGKSAGYKRNTEMARYSHALVWLWDGTSKGSKHMFDIAMERNMPIYLYRTDKGVRKLINSPATLWG